MTANREHNSRMRDLTNRPLADLLADLEISEAQLAAGDVISGEAVLAELRASIARLEAKQRNLRLREAAPRR